MSGTERGWSLHDSEFEAQREHLERWHRLHQTVVDFLAAEELTITFAQRHFLTDQVLTFMTNHHHPHPAKDTP
jgi:hypothetical protein